MSTQSQQLEFLKKALPDCWVENSRFPAMIPGSKEDVIEVVKWCRKYHWRIMPIGMGTTISSMFEVPEKVIVLLSQRRNLIVQSNIFDLVLIVETGISVAETTTIANEAGFRLDGWPASYKGSVGGLICGERGYNLRHLLLGVEFIDGHGVNLSYGGKLRKDVSGFDVPGFFAGCRGILGWLDRIYLRLTPLHAPKIRKNLVPPPSSIVPHHGLYQRIAEVFDPDHVFMRPVVR